MNSVRLYLDKLSVAWYSSDIRVGSSTPLIKKRTKEASEVVNIHVWCMRHGQKALDGSDALTELGAKQVAYAAAKYFSEIQFSAAFFSGMERARMTVLLALGKSMNRDDPLAIELAEGFGYKWAGNDPYVPLEINASELENELGHSATALEWFERYPHAQLYRGRVTEALHSVATRTLLKLYAREIPGREVTFGSVAEHAEKRYDYLPGTGVRPMNHIHVVVGTHSPVCEFAAPRLNLIPRLNVADILRYILQLKWLGDDYPTWEIVDAVHLPCPSAEEVEATIMP